MHRQTQRSPAATGLQSRNENTGGGHHSAAAIELLAVPIAARRRRPPYAAEIAAQPTPNLFVFLGTRAWERAKARLDSHGPGTATLLPDGTDAAAIDWPRMDALCLVADESRREDALRVAQAIVSGGVRCVAILGHAAIIVRSGPPEASP